MTTAALSPNAIALNRFGLGARPADTMSDDPHRFLTDQFDRYEPRTPGFTALADAGALVQRYRSDRRAERQQAGVAAGAKQGVDAKVLLQPIRRDFRDDAQALYRAAVNARADAALRTQAPFVERMVHFWSNHFCISADNAELAAFAGVFERDAIRPHVLGRFEDMLLAVERHPAMLLYLNQASSIGPDSAAGRRGVGRRGLNENLAREIMELHTLGVRSGYGQADVTEFARALTGWTIDGLSGGGLRDGDPNRFAFRADFHEPGPRIILGKRYDQADEGQARAALIDFAAAPATATHIATKLARHFAGDEPPPALVQRLAASFARSRGDLPTVYGTLIASPEPWASRPLKFKTPWEWAVSTLRGLGRTDTGSIQIAGLQTQLGQTVWKPGSPAGFDDVAASWAAPDALMRRVEIAQRLAAPLGDHADARALAPRLIPASLSSGTAEQIARSESPAGALALLLVSPDFLEEVRMVTRRHVLSGAVLGGAMAFVPRIALATVPTERRFVFVIQRGAADGLDIVRPIGDPAYAALRAPLLKEAGVKLDGMFSLHPALAATTRMYAAGQALFVHAVASPYRDRSHFDGQNVLETGGASPYAVADGWLNRLVALMPRSTDEPIAIAPTVPMALRGAARVSSYAPSALPAIADDLMTRVTALYDADPQLHPFWSSARDARGLAAGATPGHDPASLGRLTASFLTKPQGPRIAILETFGWDTHSGQVGRLATQLKGLDALLAALRDGLGPAWATTTVLVATEFGRTAAANGTRGTDHGTGAAAMLVGGAVKGGRVIADWPGLAPGQLYQQRDLRPTTSLDALIAGAASEALGLDPNRVARLFPAGARPMSGLVLA